MERIRIALNNTYAGKEFIYKSKYGRTKGVVDEIILQTTFIMDEDREKALIYGVNQVKGRGDMKKPEIKGEVSYMAFQPTFHIKSTKGIIYDLTDCYFIETEEKETT